MRDSYARLNIEDFQLNCLANGDLYVSSNVKFNHKTFVYDDETGFLYFDDEPVWVGDFFYLDKGNYIYYEGEQDNV